MKSLIFQPKRMDCTHENAAFSYLHPKQPVMNPELSIALDTLAQARIDFIKQNETPGLGARIEEEWFRKQFRGKTPPFTLVQEDTENTAPDEINAITGATYTSSYVRDMVNNSPERAAALLEEVR